MAKAVQKAPSIIREKCGTYSGYKTHYHFKETYCDACKQANAAYMREKRISNPEFRKLQNEINKRWQEENPDWAKKYRKANAQRASEYAKANAERFAALRKKREAANPEKYQESNRRKNARQRAKRFGVQPELYTLSQVLEVHGTDCHICQEPIDLKAPRTARRKGWELGLHLDHVIPLALGGADNIENEKPAHAKCNLLKAQKAA